MHNQTALQLEVEAMLTLCHVRVEDEALKELQQMLIGQLLARRRRFTVALSRSHAPCVPEEGQDLFLAAHQHPALERDRDVYRRLIEHDPLVTLLYTTSQRMSSPYGSPIAAT